LWNDEKTIDFGGETFDKAISLPKDRWRVKLYQLNQDGGWDDLGTGKFEIIKDEEYKMQLISEDDSSSNLCQTRIKSDIAFQRQRGKVPPINF
jgi:hypothetical protein